LEFEEKISDIFSKETDELVIGTLSLLSNVKKAEIQYLLFLIDNDKVDNNFSDCAFTGNVPYLVMYNYINIPASFCNDIPEARLNNYFSSKFKCI